MAGSEGDEQRDANDRSADATRSQAPVIADADATSSRSPSVTPPGSHVAIEQGGTFVDEPERYEIEGQIGAGGMGTVLAARGSRLSRSVALKIVTADREDLRRRFEREAQVTARLQHPAIVPVYGSGRGRGGQPFYVMKHVTGDPLDKVIAKTTALDQRIALLPNVIAVTEAIAYAHAERVIHRDLKPANILVGAFGETVVIDWGLAKDLGQPDDETQSDSPYREAAAAADETAFGKVMGTPAYMPVEQARGERLDERADVYALGAILYHVLSGAPPFTRPDEGSVPWESMLARVLSAAPEPLAVKTLGVPPDLVTIVIKAMAHTATDRYPTAKELAGDLRKFQTGQLVGAHHYSSWQLLRRWLRRHRTSVAVAVVATTVLAVVGIVSVRRIVREQSRAEAQQVLANESRAEAEDLLNFMLVDLRAKLQPLGNLDALDDVAKKAVAYYDGRREALSDAELAKRGLARRNLGDVLFAQGYPADAIREFRESLAITETLAAKDPTNADQQRDLSISHNKVGNVLLAQGDAAGALASYRVAQTISETLAAMEPTNANRQRNVSVIDDKVGNVLLTQGDSAGALAAFRAAQTIRKTLAANDPTNVDRQADLSVSHDRVGDVLRAQGDAAGALASFQAAQTIAETLAAKDPTNVVRQRALMVSHIKVSEVLFSQGDATGALASFRVAQTIAETLAAKDPTNADRQRDLSVSHDKVGSVLLAQGDKAGALASFRAAQTIDETLAAKDPTNADRQRDLSGSLVKVGDVLRAQGDAPGALAAFRAAQTIDQTLATMDPTNANQQRDLSISHDRVGTVLLEQGNAVDALALFRASQTIREALAAQDPTNADGQADLSVSHDRVGDALRAQGDTAGALASFRAGQTIAETLVAKDPTNTDRQRTLMINHRKVGDVLLAQGDAAGGLAAFRAAQTIAETLAAKGPTDNEDLVISHETVGDALVALADKGHVAMALAEYQAGLAIALRLQATDPKNTDWRTLATDLATKVARCCGANETKRSR